MDSDFFHFTLYIFLKGRSYMFLYVKSTMHFILLKAPHHRHHFFHPLATINTPQDERTVYTPKKVSKQMCMCAHIFTLI